MPLFFHKSSPDFQIGIWKMDEPLADLLNMVSLSAKDAEVFNTFRNEYRQREWLTTRKLVNALLSRSENSIAYHNNGKPYLVNSDLAISISHTRDFVAVLLTKHANAGIDLETVQQRIEQIAKKFISTQEEKFIVPEQQML